MKNHCLIFCKRKGFSKVHYRSISDIHGRYRR